jgi:predicted enzyme related to lactoylglutathione lyase
MRQTGFQLAGVELYFDDLERARRFYQATLGLPLVDAESGHHAKFAVGSSFVCAEVKGAEDYPSADKAVVFVEVTDIEDVIARVGAPHVVKVALNAPQPWAAVRDPEGHTVLLLQSVRGK